MTFSDKLAIIVPEVERKGKEMKIIAPTTCPSCDSPLEQVKDQLFCRNSKNCLAQGTKRLQNFCKKLKIKGFGEKTLEKLELTEINDLLHLTPDTLVSKGLSEHMANKLCDVIDNSRTLGYTPNNFLAACSIPLIGDGAMRKLKFDRIGEISHHLCKQCGIGDKAASSLIDWISNNAEIWQDWEVYFTKVKEQKTVASSKGIVVCITGKLNDFKNRKAAAEFLTSQGYEVKSSLTKAVTTLISEDGDTSKSSYKKSIAAGLTICTIKQLLEDNI